MLSWTALFIALLGSAGVVSWVRTANLRSLGRRYLIDHEGPIAGSPWATNPGEPGALGRWLAIAGLRSPTAAPVFVGSTVATAIVGGLAVILIQRSSLTARAMSGIAAIPGGIGDLFAPIILAGPWLILAILTATPCLVVRARRRRIVTEVEQDLPLVLQLLATLGEAGLGFDASIERVAAAQPRERPLTVELRGFQRDVLSGRPRVEALRRMARRVDVASLTIFTSAVVQAEQVGSGVADVFRYQSEDARDRRRDRALNLAQSLPVKLLFPLVICFLPGIFVVTLGPVFLQFFKLAEGLMDR